MSFARRRQPFFGAVLSVSHLPRSDPALRIRCRSVLAWRAADMRLRCVHSLRSPWFVLVSSAFHGLSHPSKAPWSEGWTCILKSLELCVFFASTRFNASTFARIGRPVWRAVMRSFFSAEGWKIAGRVEAKRATQWFGVPPRRPGRDSCFPYRVGLRRACQARQKSNRTLLVTWRGASSVSVPQGRQSGVLPKHSAA